MKLTPADAETLRRAADVADAQMELIEATRRRANRASRRAGRSSVLMIGITFAAVFIVSSVTLQLWP